MHGRRLRLVRSGRGRAGTIASARSPPDDPPGHPSQTHTMARPGSPTLSDADSADFTSVHWASSAAAPPPPPASSPAGGAAHPRPTSSTAAASQADRAAAGRQIDSPLTSFPNPLAMASASAPAVEDDHSAIAASASASAGAAGSSARGRGAAVGDEDDGGDGGEGSGGAGPSSGAGQGWVGVRLVDYKKEVEGGKESYVSYGIRTKVRFGRDATHPSTAIPPHSYDGPVALVSISPDVRNGAGAVCTPFAVCVTED